MIDCQLVATDNPTRHKCKICGHVVESFATPERTHFPCRSKNPPPAKPCANCPQKFPSLAEQLASAAASAGAFVASGFKISKQRLERLAICAACPSLVDVQGNPVVGRKIKKTDRCLECGCFIKAKAAVAAEDCPLSKWPSSTDLDQT